MSILDYQHNAYHVLGDDWLRLVAVFREELLETPLNIQGQVKTNKGRVDIPTGPGLGVTPDRGFIEHYKIG